MCCAGRACTCDVGCSTKDSRCCSQVSCRVTEAISDSGHIACSHVSPDGGRLCSSGCACNCQRGNHIACTKTQSICIRSSHGRCSNGRGTCVGCAQDGVSLCFVGCTACADVDGTIACICSGNVGCGICQAVGGVCSRGQECVNDSMLSHGDSICHFNGKCGLNNWHAAGEVAEGVHHTHFGRCDAGIPGCVGACHVCHAGFDQVVSGIEVDRQCNFARTVCHDGQAHVRHVFNRQCNASRGGHAGSRCQHSAVGIDGRSKVLIAVNDGVNNGRV